MRLHHTNDGICPLCAEKLKLADARLETWFLQIKSEFSDVHISCSYRGEKEQNEAFKEGFSRARYPLSKHNATDSKGNPCALALDVFQLKENAAWFDRAYFKAIAESGVTRSSAIKWGGTFKNISDLCHFELA